MKRPLLLNFLAFFTFFSGASALAAYNGSDIFFNMGPDHISTYQPIKITNSSTSNQAIPFSVNIKYSGENRGWIEINRQVSCGDYLSPGEECFVHVRTNSKKLKSGDYDGVLEVSADGSVFNLPVSLSVYPQWLKLSTDKLLFEFDSNNSLGSKEIVITNDSPMAVDLSYMTVNFNEMAAGEFFAVDFFKDCPEVLKPNSSCKVLVKAKSSEMDGIIRRGAIFVNLDKGSRTIEIKSFESVRPQVILMESSFEDCSYGAAFEVLSNSSQGGSYVVTSSEGVVLNEGEISPMGKAVVSFSKNNLVYGEDFFFTIKASNKNGEESYKQSLSALDISESCGSGTDSLSREVSALGLITRDYKTCENDTMTVMVKDVLSGKPLEGVTLKWTIALDAATNDSAIGSYAASLVLSDNGTDHEGKGSTGFFSGLKKGKYKVDASCEDCAENNGGNGTFVASVSCTDIPLIKSNDQVGSLEASLKMLLNHYGYNDERFKSLGATDNEVFQWQKISSLTDSSLELKGSLSSKFYFEEDSSLNLANTIQVDNKNLDYYIDHCVPLLVNIEKGDAQNVNSLRWVLLKSRSSDGGVYNVNDPVKGELSVKDLKAYGVKVYISKTQGECL